MTDKPAADPEAEPHPKIKRFRCRRTGKMTEVVEHVRCAYCFGNAKLLEKGADYELFCDFKPGEDPIVFGFPPDTTRDRSG